MQERVIAWLGRTAAVGLALLAVVLGWHTYRVWHPKPPPAQVELTFRAAGGTLLERTTVSSPQAAQQLYSAIMAIPASYGTLSCAGASLSGPDRGDGTVTIRFLSSDRTLLRTATWYPWGCGTPLKLPDGTLRHGPSASFHAVEHRIETLLGLSYREMGTLLATYGPQTLCSGCATGQVNNAEVPKFPPGTLHPGATFVWNGDTYTLGRIINPGGRVLGHLTVHGVRFSVRHPLFRVPPGSIVIYWSGGPSGINAGGRLAVKAPSSPS